MAGLNNVKIYDDDYGINLKWGSSEIDQYIHKDSVVSIDAIDATDKDSNSIDFISIAWNEGSGLQYTKLYVDNVTVPSVANLAALYAAVTGYMNTRSNAASASGTFTNADLVAGVLTIAHGLNSSPVAITILDPNGVAEVGSHTETDANTATWDFGGAIAGGTWKWKVFA